MSKGMKENTFKQINDQEWQAIAEKSLRGMSLGSLKTETIEGITIQPLYTKEMYDSKLSNEEKSHLKSIQSEMAASEWTIAQQMYTDNGDVYMDDLAESLNKGNEAICYDGKRPVNWAGNNLELLAELVLRYPVYATHVNENDLFTEVFNHIPLSERKLVRGVVTGINLPDGYSTVKTNLADVSTLHHEGADAVTELAAGLAMIVQGLNSADNFDAYAESLAVRFCVDRDFFMEIAKLRAFRVLWRTLTETYGGKNIRLQLLAETSLRSYTKFDSHTNLLRAGNETLSAVLGGADVFTVHPHLILGQLTPASVRTARNVQLIIREESFANAVLDPSYGSYYIDMLTVELINHAWELFQKIEAAGGYQSYKDAGKLNKRITASQKKQIYSLNRREDTLIGTNMYADVNESIEETEETISVKDRIAEKLETLRIKGLKHAPRTVLLRYGDLRDYKPRADYVKGFLASGGVKPAESPVFTDTQALNIWLSEQDFTYYIICTSFEHTVAIMQQTPLLQNKWVDASGKESEETMNELISLGIDGFIYKGQDMESKLNAILDRGENK